jgi:FtsP/CotA-like multicopper oxidase with cupredoxin domain
MKNIPRLLSLLPVFGLVLFAASAHAQSFRVQCPVGTQLHPANTAADPAVTTVADRAKYSTYTLAGRTDGLLNPTLAMANGGIKCQQLSGGDGYATMGDGSQIYMFSFGPLSGLANLVQGLPGTVTSAEFNQSNVDGTGAVLDAVRIGAPYAGYEFNGAIGLVPDSECVAGNAAATAAGAPLPCPGLTADALTGHVDPRLIMDVGVLNGNIPAPMIAIDEGDELFLTLTNVGMVMRPDLFEQHTVHFHGYANASAFYDGVPDASVAINIGGSFTYYYLAPEAGTYMWHCHISPPEHLQMGMVGQLYVRPKQNSVPVGSDLGKSLLTANLSSVPTPVNGGKSCNDILCMGQTPLPATADTTTGATGAFAVANKKYAYNDGDASTVYDVEYPIQMHGFDPNFHFVGMTFNPESFADNKDKYFLLNGRSYPDTVNPKALSTQASDGGERFSQPLPAVVNIPAGGRALLRFSDLNVTEYHTLASLGIRMHVVGYNARLLRDLDGNNTDYYTNSISLAGGESVDVILDASCKAVAADGTCADAYKAGEKYYLYTPQLDHLSNDAENFGGMMTEVNICDPARFNSTTKSCGT